MAITPVSAIGGGQLGRLQPVSENRPQRGELERRLAEFSEGSKASEEKRATARKRLAASGENSLETARVLAGLRARDSQVRGHEAAHVAVGGRYVRGGASFSYQKGPDGRQYAVGGEVGIDTAPVPGKPAETVAKMQTVRAAALAPSDPSAADNAVAAAASQMMAEAIAELAAQRAELAARPATAAAAYGAEKGKGGGAGAGPAGRPLGRAGGLVDLVA